VPEVEAPLPPDPRVTLSGEHRCPSTGRARLIRACPPSRLLLQTGRAAEALTFAQSALSIHNAASSRNHPWTKDSARVLTDALDALARTEEAKALRERYGITETEEPAAS